MTDLERDAAHHTLQVAGMQERIDELQLALARSQRENAALRVELCEFSAAVAREAEARSPRPDSMPEDTSRSLDEERATPRVPAETMAEVVDGRLR